MFAIWDIFIQIPLNALYRVQTVLFFLFLHFHLEMCRIRAENLPSFLFFLYHCSHLRSYNATIKVWSYCFSTMNCETLLLFIINAVTCINTKWKCGHMILFCNMHGMNYEMIYIFDSCVSFFYVILNQNYKVYAVIRFRLLLWKIYLLVLLLDRNLSHTNNN